MRLRKAHIKQITVIVGWQVGEHVKQRPLINLFGMMNLVDELGDDDVWMWERKRERENVRLILAAKRSCEIRAAN